MMSARSMANQSNAYGRKELISCHRALHREADSNLVTFSFESSAVAVRGKGSIGRRLSMRLMRQEGDNKSARRVIFSLYASAHCRVENRPPRNTLLAATLRHSCPTASP